MIEVAS